MTSKRVEKFAIRKRADAVTKERRKLERIDQALHSDYRSAADVVRFAEDEAPPTTTARHP